MALGNIYTFGPTFRAENSNTTRHLAEFWMIEPEMAFYELADNMDLAEELLKYVIQYALTNCQNELEFLKNRLRSEEHTSELQSLMRISYAVFCLKKKKKQTEQDIQNKHNKQNR